MQINAIYRSIVLVCLMVAGGFYGMLTAKSFQGYVVTKNNKHLAGRIVANNSNSFLDQLTFYNAFGTKYRFWAGQISGFYYEREGESFLFKTVVQQGRFIFQRHISFGDHGLEMIEGKQFRTFSYEQNPLIQGATTSYSSAFYVKLPYSDYFSVNRFNFRCILKDRLAHCPSVVAWLEIRKNRYRHLPELVPLFNRNCAGEQL